MVVGVGGLLPWFVVFTGWLVGVVSGRLVAGKVAKGSRGLLPLLRLLLGVGRES